jgi:hypothetical protein
MIRRLFVPLLGSALLLAASAGSALGKCEGANPPSACSALVVSMEVGGNRGIQAGTAETVKISIARGDTHLDAMGIVLTFARAGDASRVRIPATATPVPGLWTAEVLLPDGGSWSVMAQVVDLGGNASLVPVHTTWGSVVPALPPTSPPVTGPPVTPASPVLPIAQLLGLLAAAAVAGQLMRDRSRRRTAAAGAASASAATADRA